MVLAKIINSYRNAKNSSTKKKKDLKVAVVGGGVTGLTCAIALHRSGVDVQIYEAAAKFGEIGAGILLAPNTMPILEKIGVLHTIILKMLWGEGLLRILKLAIKKPEFFKYLSGMDGNEVLCDISFRKNPRDLAFGIHRAEFLESLVNHVDPGITHFNKRCVSVSKSATPDSELKGGQHKYTLHFQDGTTADADVVVGADGLKSVVRRYVTDPDWKGRQEPFHDRHLTFSNNYCYRALISAAAARAAGITRDYSARPIQFLGKDGHVLAAGIKGGTLINIVAFRTDRSKGFGTPLEEPTVKPVSKEELMAEYSGWSNEVITLLGCIEEPSRWNINVVFPALDSWARDDVALIGDSAHAMQPHLGAGASVGIEDAYCLAELLAHPQTTAENVCHVLQVYSDVRRPRAQQVWDGSVEANDIFEGRNEHGQRFDAYHLRQLHWDVWDRPLNVDVDAAVEMLKRRGVFV